jgi:predicted HTH transcriptional regulator
MKDLRAIRGRNYIQDLIAEGEHQHQDFKYLISDARKIARSISAFANNDGGHLLIGVKDNGVMAGVRNEEDIYVVEQAADLYCDPPQKIEFTAFNVDHGTVVIRAKIARADSRPVCVKEADGKLKAYYRVKDENIVAHPLMVEMWRKRESDDSRSALVMRLSDCESALLALLDEAGETGMSERDIAVRLHRSQSEINRLIVNLASVGIITFTFNGTRFVIARNDE